MKKKDRMEMCEHLLIYARTYQRSSRLQRARSAAKCSGREQATWRRVREERTESYARMTVNVSTTPAEGRASECLEPFTWAAKNLWSLGLRNLGPGLGAENGLAEVN